MTEQEKINHETQTKLALTDAKFSMFVDEMRDFKQEMRQQNASNEAKISEIRTSIASMSKHLRNLTVATIVGVGAIAVTAIGAIASIVLK